MTPRVTWLVVAAVAAVGLAAAVDELRGEGEAAPPSDTTSATTTKREPAEPTATSRLEGVSPPLHNRGRVQTLLEAADARGALYVADLNCRLHALRLPAVEWLGEPAPVGPCRFTINANGELFPDGTIFERTGEIGAHCRGNTVDVFNSPSGIGLRQVVGCAPAWKPDGSLTVLRDGRLVQVTGLDQQRVLLSRDDIARALGPEARLRFVAWIDNDSFGTVVRRGGRYQLAVFNGKRLVGPPSFSSPRIAGLRTDGSGLLAAETGTPQAAVSFFNRTGRLLLSVGGREFSWEPGGTMAAVAGRLEILFVAPLTGDVVPLSLVASDLEWR